MSAGLFDTPLRSAALGVLIVAAFSLFRGLIGGRPHRTPVLVLLGLALLLVLISEGLQ